MIASRRSCLIPLLVTALALPTASALAKAAAPRHAPSLVVTLAPLRDARDPARVGEVAITLRFTGLALPAGAPVLQLPLVASNVDTVATLLGPLPARDAAGPLVLAPASETLPDSADGDAVSGGPGRVWHTPRAIRGDLELRYTVPAQSALPPRGPAPPFAFSADGGAVSAAGQVFLLLPPGNRRWRTTFAFDLSRAPAGSRAASSLGAGTRTAPAPLDASALRSSFFMAGPIGVQAPARNAASGFFGAWQGRPAFDAAALLGWTAQLHGHYTRLFGQPATTPYGVFLRYNPVNAGGGVGLDHAFVTTFGAGRGSDLATLRLTLAHEMFHTFQPYLTRPAGLESSWFGEGLATFYQARLPLRFGLITPQAFLADLNWTAARYYTSAMARVPNAEVPARFWADTRVRTLPYDRGMLYFATLDHALRRASGGRVTLDTLVLELAARSRKGEVLGNAEWEALLARHLGAPAVAEFRAFLGGAMPLPASDAFGPCFARTSRPLRRYELGFTPDVLARPRRIVEGLVPGSAAAAAGLREGDEIVDPVPQDGIQGEQDQRLTLHLRRDGRDFTLDYLPRGETVAAWQWQRVPGVPDSACAL